MNQQQSSARAVAGALQELIDGVRPQGWNHLVASSGDAYVQFSRDCGDVSMLTETVSNLYLAGDRQLDAAAIETLHCLGFEDPDVAVTPGQCRAATTATEAADGAPSTSPNYFCYFNVSTPEKVAALADLLVTVYGGDPGARLRLQLIFGAGPSAKVDDTTSASTAATATAHDEPGWVPWSIR